MPEQPYAKSMGELQPPLSFSDECADLCWAGDQLSARLAAEQAQAPDLRMIAPAWIREPASMPKPATGDRPPAAWRITRITNWHGAGVASTGAGA